MITSAFLLKKKSSYPIHLFTGIRSIHIPTRIDFIFLGTRFLSHKTFIVVRNDAISYTVGPRGALHQLPRSWNLGSGMNSGAKRETFQLLSSLTLWQLLWCILFELRLMILASTMRFQFPFTAWFISLVLFQNRPPPFFLSQKREKYTKAIIISSQLSIYISLSIHWCLFCIDLEEMYGGSRVMNKYLQPDFDLKRSDLSKVVLI